MNQNEQSDGIDYFDNLEPVQRDPEQEIATLERVAALAEEAKKLEKEISDDTVLLEEKRGRLDKILGDRIPNIMTELGMEEFKLVDGSKVTVKDDIKCSLSEERKPEAFKWLEETKNDGIIKTSVSSSFGRGEMESAMKAAAALEAAGFMPSIDRNVHASTLKAFVKEQLEKGVNIPLATFGVFEKKLAKITYPKTRK